MKTSTVYLLFMTTVVTMPTGIRSEFWEEVSTNLFQYRPSKNLQLYGDNMLVGSKNGIHFFDKDLKEIKFYNTCTSYSTADKCENYNQVMIVNDKNSELITCGTGNHGKCEVLGLPDFNVVIRANNSALGISSDPAKPSVGLLGVNLTMAVTNGLDENNKYIYGGSSSTKTYAISKSNSSTLSLTEARITFDTEAGFSDFIVYYKDGFTYDGYSYFVTNQNKNRHTDMVSKMVRLCPFNKKFIGYVDFEIGCQDSTGKDYNLIQHIVQTKTQDGKVWLIGVFTRGEDAEVLSGDSVVCTTTLDKLDKTINSTWKDFYYCSDKSATFARYLIDQRLSGLCQPDRVQDYNEEDFHCGKNLYSFSYNIGLRKLNMKFTYKVDSKRGLVTAAHLTHQLNGRNPGGSDSSVMLLGTSKGGIIMTSVKMVGDQMTITEYFDYSLKNKAQISAIHQKDENILYVLSEKKLHKFFSTYCTEFSSCLDTMNGANPICGWCVRKNNATRQHDCSSEEKWLPALDGNCPSLTTTPKGVNIGSSDSSKNVIIHAENIPPHQSSDEYECEFSSSKLEEPLRMLATRNQDNKDKFTCLIPKVQTHTEVDLMIRIKDSGIVLARGKFLFYDCAQYKRCGDCVTLCSWNPSTLTCDVGNNGINDVGSCPQLTGNNFLIPSNEESSLQLSGKNLDVSYVYKCIIDGQCVDATFSDGKIDCSVTSQSSKNITNKKVSVKYKLSSSGSSCSDMISIDESGENKVAVYNCSAIANSDCSICCALNKALYKCSWEGNSCVYKAAGSQCDGSGCPAPVITQLNPRDGPNKGGTKLTIFGKNLGYWTSDIHSKLEHIYTVHIGPGLLTCNLSKNKEDFDVKGSTPEFDQSYLSRIVCTVPSSNFKSNTKVNVSLQVYGKRSDSVVFEYKVPNVTEIEPSEGPESGGTRITVYGKDLLIGNKVVSIELNDQVQCTDVTLRYVDGENSTLSCLTGKQQSQTNMQDVKITIDGGIYTFPKSFEYVDDPTFGGISPKKGFLSGGTELTVQGTNLRNAAYMGISLDYDGKSQSSSCKNRTDETAICLVPKAPRQLKDDLLQSLEKKRKRRSVAEGCTEIKMVIHMDGVKDEFSITYCRDPSLKQFDNGVLLYKSGDKNITIKGEYLNLAASKNDFGVSVGLEDCRVIELKDSEIVCEPPDKNPGSGDQQVNVTVGNIHVQIGRLQYQEDVEFILIIVLSAVGGVVILFVLVLVFGCFKYKRVMKNQAEKYARDMKNMEMEIIEVARQEFLDMHTTMSSVNRNLVEQGFPYHNYHQYACNVMFSADYLWTEPTVSNGKMTDDERLRSKKGMEKLEPLINNKFFLVSVIGTMEKQRKFFIREKSNLAGNLCAVLMGRMEYLNEVLRILMTNLVRDSSGKKAQQKALFRRCESITEKLLSNWMSLSLYPHFMSHSGSPLYLLYMALQKTIEAGPIDAVTGDSKYTLSEDRLLKKISRSMSEEDLKFESKLLTLNVIVSGNDEIFKCKVLDCDTISQVKSKCMSQIYVNYPASKLGVDPEDLFLEWHEGFGGSLRLKDIDNTSAHEGSWVRLNTLAHYNVKDDSNLALVDPHTAVAQQEDYVNLTQINMDVGGCNGSMDSSDQLTLNSDENEDELQYWHLVKKEEESSKKEKSAIAELYLNRLLTTKQSLNDYMKTMFNIVLDKDNCPPPTKFLLDFLDELADQFKVDSDTIHLWKSHSYAIRVWAALMKMPSLLFDVHIPSYIDYNLEVISQVFIESFSLSSQKFTKDSPSQKLIFHHEMTECRERAFEFYKNVKVDTQDADELRRYLNNVDKLQQGTDFNKTSALYRFYKQLKPYLNVIVEDLAQCKETKNLQLDKKLEQVMEIMEEEEEEA